MKKIIILLVLLFSICLLSHSQSLQFDSAIYIELEGLEQINTTSIVDSFVLIVPTGKTVKITSASVGKVSTSNGLPNADLGGFVFLDGKVLHYAGNEMTSTMFPIWLPQGQYTFQLLGKGLNTVSIMKAYITGISFTVGP